MSKHPIAIITNGWFVERQPTSECLFANFAFQPHPRVMMPISNSFVTKEFYSATDEQRAEYDRLSSKMDEFHRKTVNPASPEQHTTALHDMERFRQRRRRLLDNIAKNPRDQEFVAFDSAQENIAFRLTFNQAASIIAHATAGRLVEFCFNADGTALDLTVNKPLSFARSPKNKNVMTFHK